MSEFITRDRLKSVVLETVAKTPVLDIHTHLYDTGFSDLLLWGIDELLNYHYLVAEVMRYSPMPYEKLWAMPKKELAEFIWQKLFIEHSPVSEACRGVITCLNKLGIDVKTRDLNNIRKYFAEKTVDEYVDVVFKTANVKAVIMTNNPFSSEKPFWENRKSDDRFLPALRIDDLLVNWPTACKTLASWGYEVNEGLDSKTCKEVIRFLEDWIKKMKPLYMAASLPPTFMMPDDSRLAKVLTDCILPVGKEHNLAFAMMIGAKTINPGLKDAGAGVGRSNIEAVEYLCWNYPDNKFLLTMLAKDDQHLCAVATRKFSNLHLFGCWWFCNNPSIIEEIVRMRTELLGLSYTPQHSDARVLDQLVYKWTHSRKIIAKVLTDKYSDIMDSGWILSKSEIERDIKDLFGGCFEEFIRR